MTENYGMIKGKAINAANILTETHTPVNQDIVSLMHIYNKSNSTTTVMLYIVDITDTEQYSNNVVNENNTENCKLVLAPYETVEYGKGMCLNSNQKIYVKSSAPINIFTYGKSIIE